MLDGEQIDNWERDIGPDLASSRVSRFDPQDARTWMFYPIVMPITSDGRGPASGGFIHTIEWEVWDQFCNQYGRYEYLPDAVNHAMRLNYAAIARFKP